MRLQSRVFLFFAVLLLLIAFEWAFLSAFEGRSLRDEMSERASVLVRTLAQLSAEPLLAVRITRLEQLVDSVLEEKDVLYARVYTAGYTVLAATDREQEGWTYSGQPAGTHQLLFQRDLLLARTPIFVADQSRGMAEIAFSLGTLRDKIARSRTLFLIIFVGELVLAAGFAVFLEIQVVRPLGRMAGQVREIRADTLEQSFPVSRWSAPEILRLNSSLDDMRRKLKQAQLEIVERTRLATMGQLAANMSHEIRNPLEAMSGAVEILSGEARLSPDSRASLEILSEEIHSLDDYLNQLLEFARPVPVRLEAANMNLLVEDCTLLLKPLLRRKRVRLSLELQPELPACTMDVNQIKRVIVNLVLNSVEALADQGALVLATRAGPESVEVSVRDDGHGIRPVDLERIFDPYFSTKSGGSGLGLPLSRMIVEQHGGTIRVDSRFGEGTEVTLVLPAGPKGGRPG